MCAWCAGCSHTSGLQAADKAGMQARVGAAEQAAKAAERKADEACDGVIEAREEMDVVSRPSIYPVLCFEPFLAGK